MSDTVYKIRRTTDGLFSKGGSYPRFNKIGKAWNTIGYLKSHLTRLGTRRFEEVYKDCEIVEYVESYPISLTAVMEEAETRRAELQRQREERQERWRAQRLERELQLTQARLDELKSRINK